ncbi:MAG: DUF433 domain-containing protein [Ignavibacteriales bacterium]|nr:DUF433 domain-containing protein [Ignavibacteriales bacterium]
MNEVLTEHIHISYKSNTGEPVIKNTNVSVRAVAEWWLMGAQPEEIVHHLPHLTLSQVFDALSYYGDHKLEIEKYIEENSIVEELSGTRLS